MPKEYKTLTYSDTESGRRRLDEEIAELAKEGWVLNSKDISGQGWDFGKTCCLGCIFLPLALLGKKDNKIHATMERSVKK